MQTTRRELAPGVNLRCVHTNKFKSAYLSVTMMLPLEAERASLNALLPYVLRRGTREHPDLEALSAALDELYGGAIEPMVRKRGETQCVGLVAGFLDDKYALDGRPILEPAAALVGEILLNPFTQDGVFCPEYTAGERANLIDRIHSQINDKRTYAVQRLTQEMCRYENFGVDRLGTRPPPPQLLPKAFGRGIRNCWLRRSLRSTTAAVPSRSGSNRRCGRRWPLCWPGSRGNCCTPTARYAPTRWRSIRWRSPWT